MPPHNVDEDFDSETRVRWAVQTRWWESLLARPEATLHRGAKIPHVLMLSSISPCGRLELCHFVARDHCDVNVGFATTYDDPTTPRRVLARMADEKAALEDELGVPLKWDDSVSISAEIDGGWTSAEENWPAIQSRQLDIMNRLHDLVLKRLGG